MEKFEQWQELMIITNENIDRSLRKSLRFKSDLTEISTRLQITVNHHSNIFLSVQSISIMHCQLLSGRSLLKWQIGSQPFSSPAPRPTSVWFDGPALFYHFLFSLLGHAKFAKNIYFSFIRGNKSKVAENKKKSSNASQTISNVIEEFFVRFWHR